MATINDLFPSQELKARLAAAFPEIDIDTANLDTYLRRKNLSGDQRAVIREIEQLAIETRVE